MPSINDTTFCKRAQYIFDQGWISAIIELEDGKNWTDEVLKGFFNLKETF